jgi:hypothetical protein
MSEGQTTIGVVERLFAEVWGDPNGTVPENLIHDDYWSSEPGIAALEVSGDGRLVARFTGVEALARELAHYRDFYRDFVLTIREIIGGASATRGDVAQWEADRMRGDVVAVAWVAGATHPTATFTTRGGQQAPLVVGGRGISLVRVVDGLVFSADKYWESDCDILARMSSEAQ